MASKTSTGTQFAAYHPAYVAATFWIFANEVLAMWLFHQPFWLASMKAMTGHKL